MRKVTLAFASLGGGRPAASVHPSPVAVPTDREDLVALDDRRDQTRALGVAHQLLAPVRARGGVALLEVDAVCAQGLARLLAVGAARLDVHDLGHRLSLAV